MIGEMSAHFAPPDLHARVEQVLAQSTRGLTNITIEQLGSLDQLHIEGMAATRRLARLAEIDGEDVVLDAACGLAGAARYLAKTFGCMVHGIDMTEAFLDTAELFNDLTGLSDTVSLQRADVTDMPFRNVRRSTSSGRSMLRRATGQVAPVAHLEPGRLSVARAANSAISLDHAAPADEADAIDGLDMSLLGTDQLQERAENSIKDFDVGSVGVFETVLRKPW